MFAVLHVADFALHAVLRTEPARDPATPAALFDGTRKKSLALAVNAAARTAGVEVGMTAPQAVARCPRLCIRTPDATAGAEARAVLLAAGFLLSPTVEDTAPGVCTVDLRGADPAPTAAAAHAALADLARLGLPASAGIAATPLLALYAARHAGPVQAQFTPTPARPAERSSPEAGELLLAEAAAPWPPPAAGESAVPSASVVRVTDARSFLAPLPLGAADPPPLLADIFRSWGLRTLGDLTALPRDEIVRRFGREGLAFWQRAQGGEPRPLRPVALPQEFSARLEFEDSVETLEPLLFVLRRSLDRLALELRAAQYVAAEIELVLRLENEQEHARRFRLPEPTVDPDTLFRALHSHLESLHTDSAVVAVQLRLTPARPLVRQQGLFETGLRDPHGFAETLARVVAIVGTGRVGTPQLENTHRPDAVQLVPPAAVVPPMGPPPLHPPLGPPLRRFRPPLPATLELTDGRPTYLATAAFHGAVAHVRGPWRSSGDWWQADRAWQRIEYDIALAGGGLYRLLLTGEAWFVEGEYD